ncbi:putative lipid II flippase FtsW [Nocardioides jishulii]|uniref:Probable peptidoglycan glycosyltransferase FtsW n=1 Tax=Nocardioides jishulii TaxID=2575440 RepID=A0A4U2YM31_9ACTN|nr:putative lipid II flippase FtsW [Nocardioides jishulii]QCX27180.1 putative lipid II flippase FtsW [Nocardioides jishulii]TKI61665.1 putative lipid II flippase FtsW [Nocardioides jishulii]
MATVTQEGDTSRVGVPESLAARVRAALDHPLSAYYLLVGASALLLVIGLIMVTSSSSVFAYRTSGDSYSIVKRQLMWVVIALPLAWAATRVPLAVVRKVAWAGFALAVLLLSLVRVPGLGVEVNGNTNWLALGPITMQPSEVAKFALVIWAAHMFAKKEHLLHRTSHLLIPVAPGIGLVTGLVVLGHDLGTALVFGGILMALLWVAGLDWRYFVFGFSGMVALAFLAASTSLERKERLTSFVDPLQNYHDNGWQPSHGLFALASGGWFGNGIGDSTQKWGDLPEAHTDFIFAVLGEELGLVGTVLVVALFGVIAFAGVRLAVQTEDPFVRYASFGIVAWLLGQMIINVGMVLAVLPVIGIPLPLISYGGSALVPSLVALGLLVGFARREPEAAALLEARRSHTSGVSAPSTASSTS